MCMGQAPVNSQHNTAASLAILSAPDDSHGSNGRQEGAGDKGACTLPARMHRTHRSTVQFDWSCFSCWVQHAMQAFAPSVFQFGQYCVIIFSHPVGVCDTAIRAQASTVAPTSASFAIIELKFK